MQSQLEIASFVRGLPKVELHLHLEGSIRPETLRELARRKGESAAIAGQWLQERERTGFRYPKFIDFLDAFKQLSLLLETQDDYALVATRLIEELAAQNVRYAEVTLSAGVVLWKKQSLEAIFEAVAAAAETASHRLGVQVAWIFDAVRQFGVDHAREVLGYALRFKDYGVVAFGIGGDELRGPASLFADIFHEARELGLHTTAHAGESAGAESVRDAVEILKAERIGHGTSAGQDHATVGLLAERQITVEACLSSNLATGLINRVEDYPLHRFLAVGVPVTINSDDPGFFNTNLEQELILASQRFDLREDAIFQMGCNAIRGAFLSDSSRSTLLEELAQAADRPIPASAGA